jgi:hypothetical protein
MMTAHADTEKAVRPCGIDRRVYVTTVPENRRALSECDPAA